MANLTRLVVLWLLSESRLHGYQIKRTLSDPGLQFWFPIEFASIYSVLGFLERHGYARRVAVERHRNRPERTRYAITPKGRQYFQELLRDAWRHPGSPAQPIDLALAAQPELPEGEVPGLVAERATALQERLDTLTRIRRSAPTGEMVDRARALTTSELEWLKQFTLGTAAEGTAVEEEGQTMTTAQTPPAIQLIANLVVTRSDGQVLFVRYDPDDERWWLPGEDLEPYEHPDERARRILAGFEGLLVQTLTMHDIESFRGRRGWHVVFHYAAQAEGDPRSQYPLQWFPPSELPRTAHGRWERDAVARLMPA